MDQEKIVTIFTAIDFSGNNFLRTNTCRYRRIQIIVKSHHHRVTFEISSLSNIDLSLKQHERTPFPCILEPLKQSLGWQDPNRHSVSTSPKSSLGRKIPGGKTC
ncbi:hypothetical protein DVH24_020286 [Malus domestica]|uniref:Uncharacterized protein n=1 Tax=Malus domestica TaxID=3750 RepID=A0A498JBT1_MALDO|nr:hypothetical protein DVH24_020286 [Malus domestica]